MQPERKADFYIQIQARTGEIEQIIDVIARSLEEEGCELAAKCQPFRATTYGEFYQVNIAFTTGELKT